MTNELEKQTDWPDDGHSANLVRQGVSAENGELPEVTISDPDNLPTTERFG